MLEPLEPQEPATVQHAGRRGARQEADALRLNDVGHRFGEGAWLFRRLNTELRSGRSYALVGPSGSGKSTLLSIIAGWQRPVEGEVEFSAAGSVVGSGSAKAASDTPRISWVFQNPFGVAGRTVRDHVMLPILARGTEVSDAMGEADALLAQLRLGHLADRVYRELSGGEAQRLMIARGIASQPDVFLVDEPTAQLDRSTAAEVNRTLTALTVMMMTRQHLVLLTQFVYQTDEIDYYCCYMIVPSVQWQLRLL